MIELSAIDVLDQMGAVPWRLRSFGYEACLAIDVGEGRRFFAISLLVCRSDESMPPFSRITRSWPKGDHQHESINPEILGHKIGEMPSPFQRLRFSPLSSVLALRDGHRCGEEHIGIEQGLNTWKAKGWLKQDALVDVVDVHKSTQKGIRMWHPGTDGPTNVLEGHALYLGSQVAVVSCTGAATLSATMTAEPSMLVCDPDTDLRRVARAYFALAQLNYSTPTKAHRLAQPLRETDAELKHRLAQEMRGIK